MTKFEPIDAQTLLSTPLPPVRWLIPDLLPAGLALLAGASKSGKSWLCLWLSLQLAQDGEFWGRAVPAQTVLYLCLEDTYARIQNRLFRLTEDVVPDRLYFQTACESIGQGLERQIETFLTRHPETGLVIIDTLQKVREADSTTGIYASDYQDMSVLKALADRHNIALLLVHHLRKQSAADPFQQISGSNGLMGAADTIWLLQRQRMSNAARLLVTGRDMHKALKYAVKLDLIPGNPVDKVERPKLQKYMASYYTAQEMEELFQAARGSRLELIILFAAFYGLRRSEVLGLRWDAIDFEAGTLTIRHIVTSANIEGKHILIQADRAKTSSSLRTLPLVEGFAQRLRALKEQQKYNEKLCGNCYNQKFKGYLFVDEMGNLILPNTVTDNFAQLLKEHGLRKIRFHDLRHSCASLLLKQGVPMKQIQEWLGHSDISTTANIYAHLDSQSKQLSAATMEKALALPEELPESRW